MPHRTLGLVAEVRADEYVDAAVAARWCRAGGRDAVVNSSGGGPSASTRTSGRDRTRRRRRSASTPDADRAGRVDWRVGRRSERARPGSLHWTERGYASDGRSGGVGHSRRKEGDAGTRRIGWRWSRAGPAASAGPWPSASRPTACAWCWPTSSPLRWRPRWRSSRPRAPTWWACPPTWRSPPTSTRSATRRSRRSARSTWCATTPAWAAAASSMHPSRSGSGRSA